MIIAPTLALGGLGIGALILLGSLASSAINYWTQSSLQEKQVGAQKSALEQQTNLMREQKASAKKESRMAAARERDKQRELTQGVQEAATERQDQQDQDRLTRMMTQMILQGMGAGAAPQQVAGQAMAAQLPVGIEDAVMQQAAQPPKYAGAALVRNGLDPSILA